ncbi:MAG: Rieske (2Fe-2S) protein [Candidatus Sericytochromatia bacterium]|nr:Rieske (2Fe-2S) protein [Candidatus Sericytochromatia bacterium]
MIGPSWHKACEARALQPGTLLASEVEGVPLVLWRDDEGRPVAWLDRCPHRNMPLSEGHLDDGWLRCTYHGWAFDAEGRCRHVPSSATGRAASACAQTFPARETAGAIWVELVPDHHERPPAPPVRARQVSWARTGLWVGTAVLYLYGLGFHVTQNRPEVLGGPITVQNAGWLTYAMLAWYVVPACLWLDRSLPPGLRRLQGVLLASFVVRGGLEAYLLWGPKSWIPPYGIAHDVLAIALIYGLRHLLRSDTQAIRDTRAQRWMAFSHVQAAALVVEMCFAAWFFSIVDSQTDRLWFAADTPPFALLNVAMAVLVPLFHLDLLRRLWLDQRGLRPEA